MLGSKPGRLEMPSIKGALVPVLMHGTVDGMAPRQTTAATAVAERCRAATAYRARAATVSSNAAGLVWRRRAA